MKDCENCRKQPGCQRYVAKLKEKIYMNHERAMEESDSYRAIYNLHRSESYVALFSGGVNIMPECPDDCGCERPITTAEIAADCKHFEEIEIDISECFKCSCGSDTYFTGETTRRCPVCGKEWAYAITAETSEAGKIVLDDKPEYIGAGLYDFSKPADVKKETDHRERGCSNCRFFQGNEYHVFICKHFRPTTSSVLGPCPPGRCEHHEFRDDGISL